jgi:hypothetical protein
MEKYIQYIDNLCLAFDFVGTLSIAGGEPFLHPKLYDFALYALQKENFEAVVIVSNGTVPMDERKLILLKNDRLLVEFSDYTNSLNEKQLKIRDLNISLMKAYGVRFILYPIQWQKRWNIELREHSTNEMINMKKRCPVECSSVADDKYTFCHIIRRRINVMQHDIPSDYVDFSTNMNIKARVKEYLERPFFDSCRYCDFTTYIKLSKAGEQEI